MIWTQRVPYNLTRSATSGFPCEGFFVNHTRNHNHHRHHHHHHDHNVHHHRHHHHHLLLIVLYARQSGRCQRGPHCGKSARRLVRPLAKSEIQQPCSGGFSRLVGAIGTQLQAKSCKLSRTRALATVLVLTMSQRNKTNYAGLS